MSETGPICNLEAERAVLGGLLVESDPARVLEQLALAGLTCFDFYRDAHAQVFITITELVARAEPLTAITVRLDLQARGVWDRVGGAAYVASLIDGVPRGLHLAAHATILRDQAKRRCLHAAASVMQQAAQTGEPWAEIVARGKRDLDGIAAGSAPATFTALPAGARALMADLEARSQQHGVGGVATGFGMLDALLDGFKPGQLILVAARPGVGKTAFALNVTAHAARQGQIVGLHSFEMSTSELVSRLLASTAHVDARRLSRGRLTALEGGRVADALGRFQAMRWHVDDRGGLSMAQVRAALHGLRRAQEGLDLVVLDYLQLMPGNPAENRNLQLAAITRDLKLLAKELQVPVIALSQLNRAPEARSNSRPQLTDLRDSGALEQDADVVLMLYREELTKPTPENAGVAEVQIAKHRNGPTGTVRLRWIAEHTRFADWDA